MIFAHEIIAVALERQVAVDAGWSPQQRWLQELERLRLSVQIKHSNGERKCGCDVRHLNLRRVEFNELVCQIGAGLQENDRLGGLSVFHGEYTRPAKGTEALSGRAD
jgi:hypothetical protein